MDRTRQSLRVTAEVDDFLERTITLDKIDADGKVRLEETITSSINKGRPATSGVAGTGANGGGATASTGGQLAGSEELSETSYAYPRSVETTQQVGGKLLRLWVVATVDVTPDTADGTAGQPLLTQEQVEENIMKAVGFDAERGDQIQVTLAEIPENTALAHATQIPETEKWAFALELAQHASLGLAAVVALLITTMTLKKLQPITVQTADKGRDDLLGQLSSRVDENPEAVARILSAWLGQPDGDQPAALKKAA